MKRAELGDLVKCKITGAKGIVIAVSQHLHGCDRVGIQPAAGKDNKLPECIWGDVDSFVVVTKGKVKGHTDLPVEKKTGGPALRGHTPQRSNPR